MKRFLLFALGMMLLPAMALAQDMEWQFSGVFPDTTEVDTTMYVNGNYGVNGVAVDSAGKIWVNGYYQRVPFVVSADSTTMTNAILVYDADGTQASFSPIQTITIGGEVDTLFSPSAGIRTDHNGDILYSTVNTLYRLDSETGEGMAKLETETMRDAETPAFISGIGVTEAGFVVLSYVFAGTPVQVWDPSLSVLTNTVTESRAGFSRDATVSPDGQDVYVPIYDGSTVLRFHSDMGVAGTYSAPDSLLKGITSEVISFNHETGELWVSGGSNQFPPNAFPNVETNYSRFTMYAYDTESDAIVDSFQWNNAEAQVDVKLRGLGFSPDGMTAYAGNFYPFDVGVQKFVNTMIEDVERPAGIPEALTLSQNYPNPFVGSTRIEFGVHKTGPVTLKVYDVLGREVRTLVDRVMPVGDSHAVTLEAGSLPAGVYFYQLSTDGRRLSGKMLLVK